MRAAIAQDRAWLRAARRQWLGNETPVEEAQRLGGSSAPACAGVSPPARSLRLTRPVRVMVTMEAALDIGAEVNIVLPFDREDFLRKSVAPGSDTWTSRSDHAMSRAARVIMATESVTSMTTHCSSTQPCLSRAGACYEQRSWRPRR